MQKTIGHVHRCMQWPTFLEITNRHLANRQLLYSSHILHQNHESSAHMLYFKNYILNRIYGNGLVVSEAKTFNKHSNKNMWYERSCCGRNTKQLYLCHTTTNSLINVCVCGCVHVKCIGISSSGPRTAFLYDPEKTWTYLLIAKMATGYSK